MKPTRRAPERTPFLTANPFPPDGSVVHDAARRHPKPLTTTLHDRHWRRLVGVSTAGPLGGPGTRQRADLVPGVPVRPPLRHGGDLSSSRPLLPPVPRVSVVIPTFNEAKNLPSVLAGLPKGVHEVIVVDGHSIDGTVEVARRHRPDVRIVEQTRRGKGNAMACGFAMARGDIVVMLDADGSADPGEIPRFVSALVDGADFAKGTRFAVGGGSSDITPTRAWGNRWLNRIANALFGTRHTDLCYGYNAFWRRCLTALDLDPGEPAPRKRWGDGFEIETVISARMAKAHMRITEVPSFEHPRIHGESHLNTWRDGARVLGALAVERISGDGHRGAFHHGMWSA